MGGQVSKTSSTYNIANDFVSSSVNKTLNRFSTGGTVSQKAVISCDADVFKTMSTMCSKDFQKYLDVLQSTGATAQQISESSDNKSKIPSCGFCGGTIEQRAELKISASALADKKIAQQMKTDLATKIQDEILNKMSGTAGYGKSEVNHIVNIKNRIQYEVKDETLNEVITSAVASQDAIITNASGDSRISQALVIQIISDSIMNTVASNTQELKAAVDQAVKVTQTQSGGLDNVQNIVTSAFDAVKSVVGAFASGYALIIVIVFVGLILFVVLFKKFGGVFCKFPPLFLMCKVLGVKDKKPIKNKKIIHEEESESEGEEEVLGVKDKKPIKKHPKEHITKSKKIIHEEESESEEEE